LSKKYILLYDSNRKTILPKTVPPAVFLPLGKKVYCAACRLYKKYRYLGTVFGYLFGPQLNSILGLTLKLIFENKYSS